MAVQQSILTALTGYLHPVTGGQLGAGWGFGQPVYGSKLSELIENVPGVDHIAALQVIANIAQYYLTFADTRATTVHLQLAGRVLTASREKAALLPATDVGTGAILVTSFKEGDRITKVVDVTVLAVGANSLGVSFQADSTGIPRGSVVMSFDGQLRTRLTAGILPHQAVSSLPLESPLTVQPGDIVTLVYPFPLRIVSVTPEAIELTVRAVATSTIKVAPFVTDVALPPGTVVCVGGGTTISHLAVGIAAAAAGVGQITVSDVDFGTTLIPGNTILLLVPALRLDIESHDAVMPFDTGSIMATLDNAVRLPLLDAVAAVDGIVKIRLASVAPGDVLTLASNGPGPLTVRSVEPVYDRVVIDGNFLVYSGNHQIAMVEK
jgi:hypothetical protein